LALVSNSHRRTSIWQSRDERHGRAGPEIAAEDDREDERDRGIAPDSSGDLQRLDIRALASSTGQAITRCRTASRSAFWSRRSEVPDGTRRQAALSVS
jgi:hypothetical protein